MGRKEMITRVEKAVMVVMPQISHDILRHHGERSVED